VAVVAVKLGDIWILGDHRLMCGDATKDIARLMDGGVSMFGGGGSTLIAAERLGRRCYMMEIDPGYCATIIKRWEAETGKKAHRQKRAYRRAN
jgi:DNA modification methylase